MLTPLKYAREAEIEIYCCTFVRTLGAAGIVSLWSGSPILTRNVPMPIGANDSLSKLYEKQKLLWEEATRLEKEREPLDEDGKDAGRHYILEIEIAALRQEASRISLRIVHILESGPQR